MKQALLNIIGAIRQTKRPLAPNDLDRIIRARNREVRGPIRNVAKKNLLPYYKDLKANAPKEWQELGVDENLETLLVRTLQVKPRRTASGVATITVLTKPWPCSGSCIYCPNDVRMPKSYLHDEPACQRAERNWFDPYLQVAVRMHTLQQMGHVTDKVELIVLGGTFSDYPQAYQVWFIHELFRALNEAADDSLAQKSIAARQAQYTEMRILNERDALETWAAETQARVNAGETTYNHAVPELFGDTWDNTAARQRATFKQLEEQHRANEDAAHRCVGLVVETRPDAVNVESLTMLRRLGCTKLQMGVQSLDANILKLNKRGITPDEMARAFALTRLFGFKSHAHFMANLLGATPESDAKDYLQLMQGEAFQPDEVKLYPCALVDGTGLVAHWIDKSWRPYTEEELVGLLADDVEATPPFTRISRMIRDISAHDIMTGNKKVNLRQLVDEELTQRGHKVQEIRSRELALGDTSAEDLTLNDFTYETTNTSEHFLQWVTSENKIAGFLRLSLPKQRVFIDAEQSLGAAQSDTGLPIKAHEAMIREVHVYGRVAGIGKDGQNAQHHGLGTALVERACEIAANEGYEAINVISAIGTRNYYRRLGFEDNGLYQQRDLRQNR